MHKFSVLIPVYKKEKPSRFFAALTSIFENSLKADEVLLVCDGPLTRELNDVIDAFCNYENFRILQLPSNLGIVHALNFGLKEVKFDLVIRCDSDDINQSTRFEKLISKICEGYDVVGSQTREVDTSGRIIAQKLLPLNHYEIVKYARKRNPINHMTVAFRASHALEVGGYPDVHLKEDYALWAKLMGSGRRFVNLSDALVFAHAGIDMYSRRGGIRAAISEFKLQRILVESGVSSLIYATFIGFTRAMILFSPIKFRAWMYKKILRKSP